MTVGLIFGLIQFLTNVVVLTSLPPRSMPLAILAIRRNITTPPVCWMEPFPSSQLSHLANLLTVQLNLPIGSVCPTMLDAPDPTLPPPDLAKLSFADVTNGTNDAAIITLVGTALPWPMGLLPPTGNFLTKTGVYPTEAQTYCPNIMWFGSKKILW